MKFSAQRLYSLSRTIHHLNTPCINSRRLHWNSAARPYSTFKRFSLRTAKPLALKVEYYPYRNFILARLATRLLKIRYLVLGSAVGGGYTAKKTYDQWKEMMPDLTAYKWIIPDFIWELDEHINFEKFREMFSDAELAKLLPDFDKVGESLNQLKSLLSP
ncbi:dynamin-like 120 kDa protein, mitochondrial, partial [Rhincodon typus]|uniref:dynamin-like 120 kDa protein, mitochondrial n=1 Tax=Rhincodon typus TaxID=259920 RepID=UPI00202F97E0